jgi:hypothetical protein
VKKRNLKDIFLSLLAGARRRAGGKPSGDSFETSAARAEAKSETGGPLLQKPLGPPEDWLAKRSGGPPVHWIEHVRRTTPETLWNGKRDEADATSRRQDPRPVQRKSAESAPLRLEWPGPASRSSLDSPRKPILGTESRHDDHRRPGPRNQEASPPSFPVNTRKRDADDLGKNSKKSPELRDKESTGRSGDHAKESTGRSGDQAVATQLQIGEATAQAKPSFQRKNYPFAPLREPGLSESSFSQERKDAKVSKVLFDLEHAIDAPDKDERRRQVREDTADDPGNHPPLKDDGAEKFSFWQKPEQENVGQQNVNRQVERLGNFPTCAGHQEFPTPSTIRSVKVTRRQVTPHPDISQAEAQRASVRYDRAILDSSDGDGEGREEVITKPVELSARQDRLTKTPDKGFAAQRRDTSCLLASCDSETGADKQLKPHFITSTPAPTSYDVSAGRWPALFESSTDDYFDEAMAALRELSRDRRLAREQAGNLWSE